MKEYILETTLGHSNFSGEIILEKVRGDEQYDNLLPATNPFKEMMAKNQAAQSPSTEAQKLQSTLKVLDTFKTVNPLLASETEKIKAATLAKYEETNAEKLQNETLTSIAKEEGLQNITDVLSEEESEEKPNSEEKQDSTMTYIIIGGVIFVVLIIGLLIIMKMKRKNTGSTYIPVQLPQMVQPLAPVQ